MKSALILFTIISFSAFNQNDHAAAIVPTINSPLDSTSSYIYAASMEIMWDAFGDYLGEEPKSSVENETFQSLNEAVSENYKVPLEDEFVVANCGLVGDSIIQKINKELQEKFETRWNAPNLPESALVSYANLKKDIKFYYNLDDDFDDLPFRGNEIINVDYFGIKEGIPTRSRKDVLVHDFKNTDNFIVQVKARDTLDEVYFAKIPLESTLEEMFEEVLIRTNSGKTEYFDGGDVLRIPYIMFDTTKNYVEMEGIPLENEVLKGKAIQLASQRIKFELNDQGIKLESSVAQIIDFADFENPPPRILAFDKPFLIVLKRRNADLPYFMYRVSGAEFMRSYILKSRTIEEHELPLVGTWKNKETILVDGTIRPNSGSKSSLIFKSDGTYEITEELSNNRRGTWNFSGDVITLRELSSGNESREIHWILDEFTPECFTVGGKTKLVVCKE